MSVYADLNEIYIFTISFKILITKLKHKKDRLEQDNNQKRKKMDQAQPYVLRILPNFGMDH